jgi:hypothetical protein
LLFCCGQIELNSRVKLLDLGKPWHTIWNLMIAMPEVLELCS